MNAGDLHDSSNRAPAKPANTTSLAFKAKNNEREELPRAGAALLLTPLLTLNFL